jgi:crotonobetainyl-CoA:carnitine CoA-transferase CaiB-like acyl-CoA transferase
MDNRGKRSVMLDLGRPEGRDAVLRLVDRCDVFITNLLPTRRRRYGLDHESLLARNPRLVMGAISGYGLGGEEEDRPAFDYAAYWARTGMMDAMRDEGLPPSLQRPGVGDHAAASNLVCGILAALRMVEATGQGRYVDVSLLQTGLYILGNDVANALVTREPARRHDRRAPANPLWNSYPVAEGRWILLVMIDADRYWPRFCEAIERADLRDDPRFVDGLARTANARALVEELEGVFQQHTLQLWEKRLDAADLIWSPVHTLDEAIDDPQARALGYFQELEHERAGRFETVSVPLRIEGVPLGARRAASAFHGDAEAVLREAGLSDAEIEKLL